MKTLSIIGAGRVGTALGLLFSRHGYTVAGVFSRTPDSAVRLAALLPGARVLAAMEEIPPSDIILLATPDDSLADVAWHLAAAGVVTPNTIVFHCSGTKPASILEPLRGAGAKLASIHPVKSFTDPMKDAETFPGTWCGVEGDEDTVETLSRIFTEGFGAHVFPVRGEGKTLYHAAMIFMCNGLFPLIEAGFACYEGAGIDRGTAAKIAAPILQATIANALTLGPAQAFSGPIARGDAGVVAAQLAALDSFNPGYAEAYRVLGRLAADLSEQKKAAAPEKIEEIRKILSVSKAGQG